MSEKRTMSPSSILQQQSFDELVTCILSRFASGTNAEVDAHIQASLRELSEFMGVDYALVVRAAPDLSSWSVAYEWCSPIAPSRKAEFQQVPMGSWRSNEQAILSGEVLQLDRMEDVPVEHPEVRRYMESLGFKATLQVPTRRPGGQISGCVALVSLTKEIAWGDDDIQRLKLVAGAIANAMERAAVEKDLRESETRFRTTFEQAPVGIVNVSPDGRLIRANQRFCSILGYTHEDVIGRHYAEFTHPDDFDATSVLYRRLSEGRDSVQLLEKRYLRKDGQVIWANVTLSRLDDDDGKDGQLLAVIEDITARKQAEETFDAVPDLIFVTDCQHRIVRANQATACRLGLKRNELLGQLCDDIIQGSGLSSDEDGHQNLAAEGKPHKFETYEPKLGGHFLVSCTPVRDSMGKITGTVHVARDVTVLRESEAALRQAHEQLRQRRSLVVAASLDGVWEWDARSEEVQYSKRFAELLGYDLAEVPQKLDFFRDILHPDDSKPTWDAVDRHLQYGDPCDVECRLRTKAGEYRWFRTRGQAQRDGEDRPIWMAGSLQDIHSQKIAELNLRKALDEVERLSKRLQAENFYLQEEITSSLGFDEIVGESEPLRSVLAQVEHVAGTDASVLLLGETGTGKELLARAIHERSRRSERPLVKVNLAALSSSLIESELFGHVKGAFTGAISDKLGRFELADRGTLFLDEIGELDPDLQTKLLRVLQEGEFERIGSTKTLKVDVRIVTATNRDLRRAMEQGAFRPDLYYRLAVFPVEIPPLRLRRDDIPLLVWHFIGKKQVRLGKAIDRIPDQVMRALVQYDWPGNIRELENVVERAMILSVGSTLSLPESLRIVPRPAPATGRDRIDRDHILAVLDACHWKVKGHGNAAERLGLKPSTLRYRMKTMGIQRPTSANSGG
jgi:PAS domain S-box-containing protein